jgi:hypothetical protein
MPAEFLTKEQEERYGRFCEAPNPEQLTKYFWLDDQDHSVKSKFGSYVLEKFHNGQLGTGYYFSIQTHDEKYLDDVKEIICTSQRKTEKANQYGESSIV